MRGRSDTRKDIEHPLVGRLMFEHTTLQVPTLPEIKIMIYTPLPETDTLEKLQQLMGQSIAVTTPHGQGRGLRVL